MPVVIGVNSRGEKRFLAIEGGVRESTQSWRELPLDLKERGIEKAPKHAVGDGGLGFWAALKEIFPNTRHQRCWVHYADLRIMPICGHARSRAALKMSA